MSPSLVQAEVEHVTLQLKWTHQFQFAGYYAAIEQGYYRDVGLDVSLREAKPGINPIHVVIHRKAEYGVGTSELLLDRGEGSPVVVLGVIFQHSPLALIVHADSDIWVVNDLLGKRIMSDSIDAGIAAMLQRDGVLPRYYKKINHDFKLKDWIQGKVDALSVYITDEPFQLSQQGISYRMFKPIDFGIDFYGDNLFTTEQEIHDHPQRVQAFLDASIKGWAYAMDHPDEIIQLILKKYHSRRTIKGLRFEAKAMQGLLEYGTIPTGYMFDSRWLDIVHTYQSLGQLSADFKLQGFLYKPLSLYSKLWSWRWQLLVALLIFTLMSIIIVVAFLRKLVAQRTMELQQATQQAEQANANKSSFLAAASHDLRQPMQAMRLYIDVLGERLNRSENQTLIDKLQATHGNMNELLDMFLNISQLDSGSLKPHLKTFDLAELLQQLHDQYQISASAAGLTFQITIPTHFMVHSDPGYVKAILTNLISNALRYTDQGGIDVIITLCKPNVCLAVRDSGIGIEQSKQNMIFQEFVQLDNSERDRKKGVGLGLSIASRICHQLGSQIQLVSKLGNGSVFSFELPLAPAAEEKQHISEAAVLKHDSLMDMLVFVIDDDNDVRDALTAMLEQWHCHVMSFSDNDMAVAAMQRSERTPDAILSDYRLPNKANGIDLICQLRRLANKNIPALLLTGDTEAIVMNAAVEAAIPMLTKPVNTAKLHMFLSRCGRY